MVMSTYKWSGNEDAVEVVVREPHVHSLEEMLTDMLKEAKETGNREQIRRALLQVCTGLMF
eukprot:scaffold654099_cov61-Prasinocladus_malaysianus.AAC.1